jgi:hypothetical protein
MTMTTCIDDHKEQTLDICSTFRLDLLATMQAFSQADVCPTCALYAIASTLGTVFKNSTNVQDDEIMKVALSGLGQACSMHVEVVAEGSIN